ncbi:MAG: arginase family protein [Actinomycetota bacterium]
MTRTTLVGVPIDSVGIAGGTELGPRALRETGIVEAVSGRDAGDLDVRVVGTERDPESGVVGVDSVARTTVVLRERIHELASAQGRLLVLGGCCTMAVGVAAGFSDAIGPVGVAYLDGHTDLYDGGSSPSGEAADMPLSVLFGRGPRAWQRAAGGVPALDARRTALLGYRDRDEARGFGATDPSEVPGLTFRDLTEVREDPSATGAATADALGRQGPFWIFVDLDVLSTEAFPATDALQPGGMDWSELAAVLSPLAAHPSCVGLGLACYNPEKDPDRASAREIVSLARTALTG